MNGAPPLLGRLRSVDWQRLNYILIPSARSRKPLGQPFGEPSWRGARRLWNVYRTFTPEGRWLVTATLVAGAFAADVTHTQVYVLFCALGSVLFASFLVSRALRAPDVSLRVHAPSRVFVGAEASFVVECTTVAAASKTAPIRVDGPFLPYFGRWLSRPAPMVFAAESTGASTILKARFTERGDLTLGRFRISALVPLGLTSGPPLESPPVRLRVVPRPANVLRLGMALATRHQPGGVALASKTGESMDLRGVRPYRKGDRIRDLSARTWARTGKPAVREYQEEYFTRVGVVLDCIREGGRFSRSEDTFEAAVSLTAGVVAHLGRGEALVDLLVAGGQIHALTLGRSLGFLEQALDHLAVAEIEPNVDRAELAELLTPYLVRLSALVMIVDGWDEARDGFVRAVEKRGVRVHCIAVGEGARSAHLGRAVKMLSARSILAGHGLVL